MDNRARSWALWVGALSLLAACSADDEREDGGGAGSPSANTGGVSANAGGAEPGGAGSAATPTGGSLATNAGAGGASGGRLSGLGGTRPSLGGNPAQGGAPAAQGGAPSSSTGGSTTPSGPTLDSLSPEELGELCADARASFDAAGATETSAELSCRTAGIFAVILFEPTTDAELQALCQEMYDDCIAEPLETDDDCEENDTCPATVAEFEACVEEYPTYLERFAMELPTCSELTMANLEHALSYEPEPTPACGIFWDQCL